MIKQLTDTQIFYKPSKELLKFIRKMKFSDGEEIPKGVLCILGKSKGLKDEEVASTSSILDHPPILETSDVEFLNSLDLDAIEEEEGACSMPNIAEVQVKSSDKLLCFEDLTWVHKFIERQNELAETDEERVYFHKLFQGTEIVLPKNEQVPRNLELEARCAKLRDEQDNVKYRAMTKNVDNNRRQLPEDTISFQIKQLNSQLIAVLQFVVSVLTGFAFGFLGLELFVGELDFGFRLLLGIICALIVALAELYFLAKKLNENIESEYKHTSITSEHANSKIKLE